MKKVKAIHFVGIKGVGMAPLALIAKQSGMTVTGSDIKDEFITDASLAKAGIIPLVGFSKDHVGSVDLVITTGAHGGYDNVEVKTALKKDIPVISQGEAVGIFMRGDIFGKQWEGISVAGSHGKTTTTSMLATIFKACQMDPSYLIGTSEIASLGDSGHFGNGAYFIAEADEYATEPVYDKKPKLLWQRPRVAIVTNIDLDHTDIYPDITSLIHVMQEFVDHLPAEGMLICNGDDLNTRSVLVSYIGRKKTFGLGEKNDYRIKDIAILETLTSFTLETHEQTLGKFTIGVAGAHNVMNAAAAIIAAIVCGLDLEAIREGIAQFSGSKRRLEFIGKLSTGALVYDDYGHHPTEIVKSLEALRASFPKKHIVCIFQPHTYSRTKAFFSAFVKALTNADEIVIMPIYASLREEADLSVSSERLAHDVKQINQNTRYLPKPIDVVKYIQQKSYGSDTLIVTMGAGDIYKINTNFKYQISNNYG